MSGLENMSKTKTYTDVVTLDIIALRLGNHLQENKFEVSYAADEEKRSWCFIQTRRIGRLKLKKEKCMNITIQGTREECKITVSDGEWGTNTIDSSNPGKITPYKGIFEDKKKLLAPIITEKHIFDYLDKHV